MTHIDPVEMIETGTPGVTAAFTTRVGGVSSGPWTSLNLGNATGDEPDRVYANRVIAATQMGADVNRTVYLEQVHGSRVHRVGDGDVPRAGGVAALDGWPRADGVVTHVPDVCLVVQTADCLPVLMWRADGRRVAAAHAGWRGLLDGVLEETAAHLGAAVMLRVVIGPAIGPCCYPVSDDLRQRFAERFGSAVVRGDAVDLRAAARTALVAAGIPDDAISDHGGCTACQPERYHSYRASGGTCGRQVGMILATSTW